MDITYPGWLWMEPAQFIQEIDDLASLYAEIRDTYQTKIDEAFDQVSRKIGFVVLTSLPVTFSVDENGGICGIEMSAKNMKGTIFEAVKDVLAPMSKVRKLESKSTKKAIAKGDYQVLIIWKAGLKAILASLPILRGEPAHPPYSYDAEAARYAMLRAHQEPAHPPYYFDPMATQESEYWRSTIAVIDRMYPELNLGAQIAAAKCGSRLYHRQGP